MRCNILLKAWSVWARHYCVVKVHLTIVVWLQHHEGVVASGFFSGPLLLHITAKSTLDGGTKEQGHTHIDPFKKRSYIDTVTVWRSYRLFENKRLHEVIISRPNKSIRVLDYLDMHAQRQLVGGSAMSITNCIFPCSIYLGSWYVCLSFHPGGWLGRFILYGT